MKPNHSYVMESTSDYIFVRRLLVALLVAVAAFLLWLLTDIWLLIFGSVLVAIILRSLAAPIWHYTSLPPKLALAAAILLILIVSALAVWLVGSTIQGQIDELSKLIPDAWNRVKETLKSSVIGSHLMQLTQNITSGTGIISGLSKATFSLVGSMADLLLVLFGGVYLAARPQLYMEGMLKLVPKTCRKQISDTVHACGQALRLWLKGQLISMIVIGIMVTLGLLLVGIPSAIALGLLAGLGEFIPIAGTLFAAFPALLLALAQGTEPALWTLAVYVVVQQIEGNIVMPLIQQHMVYLPPALTLFALMAFTVLFGPLGLLFAAPLTVVAYVAVKKLYVRETLGGETSVPGEGESVAR